MTRIAAPLLVSLFAAGTAFAQVPEDALPLSEILAFLEESGRVEQFLDVEWSDDGHWEIEYRTPDGGEEEVDIDPTTGAELTE